MRSSVLLAALCLAGALTGCKSRSRLVPDAVSRAADATPALATKLRVTRIEVTARAWSDQAGARPDDHALVVQVRQSLLASNAFELAELDGAETGARLRIDYGVDVVPGAGKDEARLQAAVLVKLRVPDDDEAGLDANVLGERRLDTGEESRMAEFAALLVTRSIGEAVGGLIEKQRVRGGDLHTVLGALAGNDPQLRVVAFATIAERKLGGAVPRLLELLGEEDHRIRDGAIGALVALRASQAIMPLTRLAKFEDLDTMRRVVDAIGSIGGDEARAYLEFVAGGHDEMVISSLAKDALERLNRRASSLAR